MKTGKRPDYKGVSTEEYFRPFTTQGQIDEISPVVQAWRLALETRRFEIQLYWTRSAYFWAFVGAAFAGYFALKTQSGVWLSTLLEVFLVPRSVPRLKDVLKEQEKVI